MPWCPKCQNEYRTGITICPDCNIELTEELGSKKEYKPVFQTSDAALHEKIVKYFNHIGISTQSELFLAAVIKEDEADSSVFDENDTIPTDEDENTDTDENFDFDDISDESDEQKSAFQQILNSGISLRENLVQCDEDTIVDENHDKIYLISVEPSKARDAMKELRVILSVESSTTESNESSAVFGQKRTVPEPSTVYVNAKDKYSEYRSSGLMFLIFGIAILIFTLLNTFHIIQVMSAGLPFIVIWIMSAVFIVIGISSLRKSKDFVSKAEQENDIANQIKTYLQENFSKETLASFDDGVSGPEVVFLKQTEAVKESISVLYPSVDEAFIDELIEEYLSTVE